MTVGLLARLRSWWHARVGGGDDVEPAAGGVGAYDYECTVCGTGVDDPDADCPLCRSGDVVATDAGPNSATSTRGDSARGPAGEFAGGNRRSERRGRRSGDRTVDPSPTGEFGGRRPAPRRVTATDDAAVERLRDLRDDRDLLERHAERWEPHPGGFRVETAAGTRIVDSREEVAALLRATDR